MTESARVGVDVVAGVLPGTPMDEVTQRWFLTSEEWYANDGADQARLLSAMNGKALAWANYLMMQPDRFNWVKLEWVWF